MDLHIFTTSPEKSFSVICYSRVVCSRGVKKPHFNMLPLLSLAFFSAIATCYVLFYCLNYAPPIHQLLTGILDSQIAKYYYLMLYDVFFHYHLKL